MDREKQKVLKAIGKGADAVTVLVRTRLTSGAVYRILYQGVASGELAKSRGEMGQDFYMLVESN